MDWTEKYRPQTLADVVGNAPSIAKMRKWAEEWESGEPKTKALVLAGTPGVGKTTAALALAHDMDWSVIELNASDARNADVIKKIATAGALHQTFSSDGNFHMAGSQGGRKLIILDEADNLYERLGSDSGGASKSLSDKGGKAQIIDTIRRSHQPIILIVNDLYALQKGSGAAIKTLAETIKFGKVQSRSIPKALGEICAKEGIQIDPSVLQDLAARAGGDLRSAVRDLQSICMGRTHITLADLASLGPRDTTSNIFDAIRHILKGRKIEDVRREVMDLDATPADVLLWVDENLPKEYRHPQDLVDGYEMLAKADRYLGRTQRTQNYRLWSYASDLSTIGVMSVRQHDYKGFQPFGFPQWLSKMSRSRGMRGTKDMLADHLGRATHQSKRKARMNQVEMFTSLFASDEEFAFEQAYVMELEDAEIALLWDEKVASKRVKEFRQRLKERRESEGPEAHEFGFQGDAPKPEPKPEPREPAKGQATLF